MRYSEELLDWRLIEAMERAGAIRDYDSWDSTFARLMDRAIDRRLVSAGECDRGRERIGGEDDRSDSGPGVRAQSHCDHGSGVSGLGDDSDRGRLRGVDDLAGDGGLSDHSDVSAISGVSVISSLQSSDVSDGRRNLDGGQRRNHHGMLCERCRRRRIGIVEDVKSGSESKSDDSDGNDVGSSEGSGYEVDSADRSGGSSIQSEGSDESRVSGRRMPTLGRQRLGSRIRRGRSFY